MSAYSARDYIRHIATVMSDDDEVLYCTENVKTELVRTMAAGLGPSSYVENVKIAGLSVETIPYPKSRNTVAIVCRRGEVFPLTEDYK